MCEGREERRVEGEEGRGVRGLRGEGREKWGECERKTKVFQEVEILPFTAEEHAYVRRKQSVKYNDLSFGFHSDKQINKQINEENKVSKK